MRNIPSFNKPILIPVIRNPAMQEQIDKYDTTIALWDKLYKVIVPILATRSIEHVRASGFTMSGVKEIDADISNRTFKRYACVSDMVDWFKEGIDVRICEVNDTKKIYEDISSHLHAWKRQLEFGLNNTNAPIEDLLAMDRFAHKVYGYAIHVDTGHLNDDGVSSYFASFLDIQADRMFIAKHKQGGGGNRVYTDKNGNTVIEPEETSKVPERNSHEDFLKKQIMQMNDWR